MYQCGGLFHKTMPITEVYLIANGDLRLSANERCWPAQVLVERAVNEAFRREGVNVVRAHEFDAAKGHGFIDSQKYGMEVFRKIPPEAPIVVVEAVWQYSHHILHGLYGRTAPILTIANWSGQWPGLVGMLNLNGCLTKAGIPYSTLWSEDFEDNFFLNGLRKWIERGRLIVPDDHVRPFEALRLNGPSEDVGIRVAKQLRTNRAIMGVFDEGCMGMYNAIIPDELLHATGVFKERLSQSALYAEMRRVSDEDARATFDWLVRKGMRFVTGSNSETELTEEQILTQCKMYIAALRIADAFGCDTIGIQYQQGLKDLSPASDLVEGLLNNTERPPVFAADGRELYAGRALPHFNEVDECSGLDALVTHRLWTELGFPPETTLHDVRYGEDYHGEFVWVFEISGSAPPAHFIDGFAGAVGERQPPMYFPLGGSTLKGISKPGEIVWSRIFILDGTLCADLGRAKVIELPREETERRWQITTPQWPIMHAVLYGVSRDQMMARHKANHIQVAYCPDAESADAALAAKGALFQELGFKWVSVCGDCPTV